ncbi:Itaconate transport protein [Zalerion maritima]|uniref:Itaconate transport protein n=1 Tax=Zalerion maritima TaxID=339359 RepID=A0AAD5WY05_9PEZI|nr:Itaconate transport protein [Zalerion maritima]
MGASTRAEEAASGVLQLDEEHGQTEQEQQHYSMYSKKQKWAIVSLVAPFPANIYFPAIPQMTVAFGKSVELINQTVTAYLVMQGVSLHRSPVEESERLTPPFSLLAPMLWGPLSDRYGRRPIFLVCLAILVGSCVGLALCPTSAYWLLLLLSQSIIPSLARPNVSLSNVLVSMGIGAGVIGDITTPTERGSYMGLFSLGPMIAPIVGPAMAGSLAEHLGWRSIFWALLIMAVACFLLILLFLPETGRNIAGNGSVPLGGIHLPVIPLMGAHKESSSSRSEPGVPHPSSHVRVKSPINPFLLFTYPDVLVTLSFTGVVYAVNYTIQATISSSFAVAYPNLSETVLGLCYLPTGLGMILGTTVTGRLLDWEYARTKQEWERKCEDTGEQSTDDFPKEYARLRDMPWHLVVFSACVIGWGFCLQAPAPLGVSLGVQVVLGYMSMAILNTTMTLMIDILQSRSSAATACTNLVRCSLAAIMVSVIEKMTSSRLKPSWSYVLLGGICLLQMPLMYVEMKFGRQWRLRRDRGKGASSGSD